MPTKVIMPQMGESILEGTVTKWLHKVGERVLRDEPLFEISTDKVDSEIPSPATGVLIEILVPEGQAAKVNTAVAVIEGAAEAVLTPVQEERNAPPVPWPAAEMTAFREESKQAEAVLSQPVVIRTSPLVRRIAREHNIDLSLIQGTGLSGRITKEDLSAYLDRQQASTPAPESTAPAPLAEGPAFPGETETVSMTPMRKAIADHMIHSRRTSAHVQTVFEVDMSAIVRLREEHKDDFERRAGIKLNYTAFFVKALVDTVCEFPILNCSVSEDRIIFKKPINVGIAVALETGLIVPVIQNSQLKSFTELAISIQDLAERARTKRLKPEEVQHGTITITNPGVHGSLFGTPIINQPQVAILCVGGLEKRPVVIQDAIAIRTMAYLVLSFDHRVIDGAVADRAMTFLKSRLQSWTTWME